MFFFRSDEENISIFLSRTGNTCKEEQLEQLLVLLQVHYKDLIVNQFQTLYFEGCMQSEVGVSRDAALETHTSKPSFLFSRALNN